jgi:signal transduction histidine kinase
MSIVAGAIEQARPLIEARAHVLEVEPGAGHIEVMGERNRLVQVLANLLNNAAKYTAPGGRILVAVEALADAVSIHIRDNGIGIGSSLLPHVFDLFTQAERTPDRSQGGLGIGLALVKNVVALHGGTVTAHSEGPGMGATFSVTLKTL